MNILVFVKQVPGTTDVQIDPETNTLKREGVESILNPFDEYAVEEAVRLKERFPDVKTYVMTMGPPQADSALREAISMGCDKAILVSDKRFAASDTWVTSYVLSKTVDKIGDFDVLIAGKQATDGDTAQVGPGIATWLNIPSICYVKHIHEIKPGYVKLERMMDDGYDVIEIKGKFLITVLKELNEPRIPSFRGKMAAKSANIPVWGVEDIEADPSKLGYMGSPTRVVKAFTPPPKTGGIKEFGDTDEVVQKLYDFLKQNHYC